MNPKHNEWKILQLFKVAAIAAIFTSAMSQATVVKAQEIVEPTIEYRLAKVRERLKQIEQESDNLSSQQNSFETEADHIIKAQWPNYWNDWSNWSNGWSDWQDFPWNNWANWSNY